MLSTDKNRNERNPEQRSESGSKEKTTFFSSVET